MTAQMGTERDVPGIQSVEVGGTLISALADEGAPMTLTAVARKAGMPNSKARRYLVSFMTFGLVQQDSFSGMYSPGPLALKLGLAALAQVDIVRQSAPILREIRDAVNETVVLALSVDGKPVILRREDSYHPITLNIRIGSTLPLDSSATGKIFTAYRLASTSKVPSRDKADSPNEVITHGYAEVEGDLMAGLYGISVPIFDAASSLAGALTLVSQISTVHDARRLELRETMLNAGKKLSVMLGHTSG
jgi:DNA-binding IclR family transcriptional regulator